MHLGQQHNAASLTALFQIDFSRPTGQGHEIIHSLGELN